MSAMINWPMLLGMACGAFAGTLLANWVRDRLASRRKNHGRH